MEQKTSIYSDKFKPRWVTTKNNMLTKKIGTATVAAAMGIACLFPAIAQAQVIKATNVNALSDEFSNEKISFSLDTSVANISSSESVGNFPGAIQNFATIQDTEKPTQSINLTPLSFTSGNLTISKLTVDPTTKDQDVLPIITGSLGGNIKNITFSDLSPSTPFNNDWFRGDVTFPNTTATLTLFIPSNNLRVINSLSVLNDILDSGRVQAVVSRPDVGIIEQIVASNPDPRRKALNLPEPSVTGSLLGLGAIGAISLLKRNQRLKKAVEL